MSEDHEERNSNYDLVHEEYQTEYGRSRSLDSDLERREEEEELQIFLINERMQQKKKRKGVEVGNAVLDDLGIHNDSEEASNERSAPKKLNPEEQQFFDRINKVIISIAAMKSWLKYAGFLVTAIVIVTLFVVMYFSTDGDEEEETQF